MEKRIDFQGKQIHYSVVGEGDPILFIHGYLESSEIWGDFIHRFSGNYQVICVDLPGHGKSGVLGQVHDMELLADAINAVVEAENVSSLTLFGHSMGGYVTMEYVNKYFTKIRGYCLFHSTCFADDEDKKSNRDREISLVMCGKKMQIIKTNIPKAFAESNFEKLGNQVLKAKQIAASSPDEGIIALLRGMKARKDHSETLKEPSKTPLLIWGRKDNYIGEETFNRLLALAPHASVIILENSGHMGFIEEPESVYSGIVNYLNMLK